CAGVKDNALFFYSARNKQYMFNRASVIEKDGKSKIDVVFIRSKTMKGNFSCFALNQPYVLQDNIVALCICSISIRRRTHELLTLVMLSSYTCMIATPFRKGAVMVIGPTQEFFFVDRNFQHETMCAVL
ncbi:hypothetical protein PENTCL1PPCAC_8523, partial [Pristionchus entomophagus]